MKVNFKVKYLVYVEAFAEARQVRRSPFFMAGITFWSMTGRD